MGGWIELFKNTIVLNIRPTSTGVRCELMPYFYFIFTYCVYQVSLDKQQLLGYYVEGNELQVCVNSNLLFFLSKINDRKNITVFKQIKMQRARFYVGVWKRERGSKAHVTTPTSISKYFTGECVLTLYIQFLNLVRTVHGVQMIFI